MQGVPVVLCVQQLAPGRRPGKAEDARGIEAFLTHCRQSLLACRCIGNKIEVRKQAVVHCCTRAYFLTALAFVKA